MNRKTASEIDARITFPECGVQLNCLIKHIGDDIYRVCEHPTFAEDQIGFGDCAKIRQIDDQNYEFQEVASRSGLRFSQYVINDEILLQIQEILDKIGRTNGYWQIDCGGILYLYYDADVFDPRSDLETLFEKHKEN